jgi:glycosyltransferase involved in cell wall biosynthesis
MKLNTCFIIPNYNHGQQIENVIRRLNAYQLPIIMVNDGSDADIREQLDALANQHSHVNLLHHPVNQGKGGAVQTAIKYAFSQGFTHALQIDADGQHCLDDIGSLLALSRDYPDHVISGKPVFDESIPKHRYISRYITHFWVCLETLSFQLADTMCGFRVYPLAACTQLMTKQTLGKRMDFDIEILVRLFWRGVATKFHPTKVIYPEDGNSHFKLVKDNLLISWMHTRLMLGMLLRLPWLLSRKIRVNHG